MDITQLLTFMKQAGGSDLHINAGFPPMIRVHEERRKLKVSLLTNEDIYHLIYDIMNDEQNKSFKNRRNLIFHANAVKSHVFE